MNIRKPRRSTGFTMVEALVGLGILSILVAFAPPALADFVHFRRLEGVANEIQSDLALMRAESMGKTTGGGMALMQVGHGGAKNCYSVDIDDGSGGTTCDGLKPPGRTCASARRSDAEIKTVKYPAELGIRLSTTAADTRGDIDLGWRFRPASFRILVEGKRAGAIRLDISSTGRVKACTPAGWLRGYPPCT